MPGCAARRRCFLPSQLPPALRFLAQVRDEIIENVEATYKETDLFKMFQTGDVSRQLEHCPALHMLARQPAERHTRPSGSAACRLSCLCCLLCVLASWCLTHRRLLHCRAMPLQLANLDRLDAEQGERGWPGSAQRHAWPARQSSTGR